MDDFLIQSNELRRSCYAWKIICSCHQHKYGEITSGKSQKQIDLKFSKQDCENHGVQSYNVIGEIKGSEFPDEVIVVGGHLGFMWDLGDGNTMRLVCTIHAGFRNYAVP
jgi:hypothetical protein